jgi:hypothetical protein
MAAVPRGHPIWTPPPTIRIKKKNNRPIITTLINKNYIYDKLKAD